MTQLAASVDATDEVWTLDALPASPFLQAGDELVEIRARYPEHIYPPTQETLPPKIRVNRAVAGTSSASHNNGTTLTPVFIPSLGGSQIDLDGGARGGQVSVATAAGDDGGRVDLTGGDAAPGIGESLGASLTVDGGQASHGGHLTLNAGDGGTDIDGGEVTISAGASGSIGGWLGAAIKLGGGGDDAAGGIGFNGASPVIPVIPASPDAQDIADALVALGLCTQAAP